MAPRPLILLRDRTGQLEAALASLDEVLVCVAEAGRRILFISGSVFRMTRRSSRDLIADVEGLLSLVAESHRQPLSEAIARAPRLSAMMRVPAARNVDRACATRWLEIRYCRAADGSHGSHAPEQTVACLVRDVTAQVLLDAHDNVLGAELEWRDRAVAAASDGIATELRTNEARLSLMFSRSPDGLALMDSSTCVFMANDACLRLTGLRREQVIGFTLAEISALIEPRAAPVETWAGLPRPADADTYVDVGAPHRRRAKRHTLHLQDPETVLVCGVTPIPGSTGNEYVLHMRDNTREHQFNMMASEFLSTAMHELRTPMACILGFAELLAEGLFTAEDAPEYVRLIHEQASEMSRTLDDLLDMAQIEAGRAGALTRVPESAATIATDLAQTWRVAGDPRSVQLQVACAGDVSVLVDRMKIRQALRNLLSNAFKYSTAPSPVTLSVHEEPAGPVVFTVSDEDLGMTTKDAQHAFDRFYRAEATASIKGAGLGLNLVKQIVELHGGMVGLTSAVGKGTVVTVTLPKIP